MGSAKGLGDDMMEDSLVVVKGGIVNRKYISLARSGIGARQNGSPV